MKKFEYKLINYPDFDSELEERLNKYGEMGWEVVGYSSDIIYLTKVSTSHHFVLKREIK
jgi:hypothetical protein